MNSIIIHYPFIKNNFYYYLNEKLDNLPQKSLKRRLTLELREIIKYFNINEYSIDIIINNTKSYNIIIYNYNNDKTYDFLMNDYPFYPPKLKINGKDENYYLQIKNKEFRYALFKYKNIDCFCCHSLTCINNWIPTKKMIDIIKQFEEFEEITKELNRKLITEKIVNKYLNSNINIIEWLY